MRHQRTGVVLAPNVGNRQCRIGVIRISQSGIAAAKLCIFPIGMQEYAFQNRLDRQDRDWPVNTPSLDNIRRTLIKAIEWIKPDAEIIGVSAPGPVFDRQVKYSSALPFISGAVIPDILTQHWGNSYYLVNNTNAWVNAEFKQGQSPKYGWSSVILVSVGTTIGGGAILNGIPHIGETGQAAELGHSLHNPEGPVCEGCQRRGCTELYSGGKAIEWFAGQRGYPNLTASEIADIQDAGIVAMLNEAREVFAVALHRFIFGLDVNQILIGGGLVGKVYRPKVLEKRLNGLDNSNPARFAVAEASFDPIAGSLLGNAHLAFGLCGIEGPLWLRPQRLLIK